MNMMVIITISLLLFCPLHVRGQTGGRDIREIIVHCAATPEGRDYTVADIDLWHRQRGFQQIGYHVVVYRDGSIHEGRPLTMAGAHCKGHNAHSIGICYIGGVAADGRTPKDTRTPEQRRALRALVEQLKREYPHAIVLGHCDLNPTKACPCFDASKEYNTMPS